MEGPITFGLWGWPDPARKADALDALLRARPEATRRQLLQAVSRGQPILVAENLGWKNAQTLKTGLDLGFLDSKIFQSGYGPADQALLHECAVHLVYYGGVLGCPVCRQWHLETSP